MKPLNDQIHAFVKEVRLSEEVKLKGFFQIFSSGKRMLIVLLLLFAIMGLISGLTSPEEYITTSQVLTEASPDVLGRGGLANLVGLPGNQMANHNDVISPQLFPQIIANDDFLLKLINESYFFEKEGVEVTIVEYFSNYEKENWITLAVKFPIRLITKLVSKPKKAVLDFKSDESSENEPLYQIISNSEVAAIGKLRDRIEITNSSRVATLSTKMPDAKVSAIINKKIITHLIDYVTGFQTDRQRKNLEFIEAQLATARADYENSQLRLASFRDSNRALITDIGRSQEQRLQSEYNLAFGVFNSLAQESEQAKIRLQESRPIVTVFQNPSLPLKPSEPSVIKSVVVFCFLGFFVGIMIIGIKIILEFYRQS